MIDCGIFYKELIKNNINYFCGVPDSLLKNICAYITDNAPEGRHIIASNEGAAAALAAGWYLGSGRPGLIYMQNSGIGNAVNPLLSLADPAVYSIPMLLLIGWRGEPGVKDEPQHKRQGELTLPLLETLGIPYSVIDGSCSDIKIIIERAVKESLAGLKPYAIVVKKDTFAPYIKEKQSEGPGILVREKAVILAAELAEKDCAIVSTTGMISRELYEYRENNGLSHDSDFLTVGSMGHSSQIAAGIAASNPGRKIYCFDGDGAVIMHMGSLAVNGTSALLNFIHIVFNNASHDSVGGQMTAAGKIDLCAVARACRYKTVISASDESEMKLAFDTIRKTGGPSFLEIRVKKGARENLGRPAASPQAQKNNFIQYLSGEKREIV